MLKVKEYFFNTFYKYFAMQFSEGKSGWVAIIFGISIFLYELGFVKKFVKNKQNQIDKAS